MDSKNDRQHIDKYNYSYIDRQIDRPTDMIVYIRVNRRYIGR